MKIKRGKQDHEMMIKDDILKVLQPCFELEDKEFRTINRGDFTFDQFIELKALTQKPEAPWSIQRGCKDISMC